MRRSTLGIFTTLALAGCAYVPDLEPETSFSYADVALQIECETYYAAALLVVNDHDSVDDDAFDRWSMDITITPNLSYESQASLAGSHKLQLTPNFVQLTVGGGASPSSANYDMYGTANAKNEYQFRIGKLFQGDPNAWKKSDYIIDRRSDGSIAKVHRINPYIEEACQVTPGMRVEDTIRGIIASSGSGPSAPVPPASPSVGVVPNFLNSAGFFGVYDFLKRSFHVNDVLAIPPKTLTYSKEYKVKVQLGITPGWFTLHGNISPNVGGIRIVDNTVTLAFAPPAPPTQPTEVIVVGTKEGTAKFSAVPGGKAGGVAKVGSHNGVSARTSDTLTNAVNSALFSSQLNRLNLPAQ
jgi:hypothetical protein